MTATRRALLDLLAARSGQTQTELAKRARVSTRTARRHLRALVKEGTVLVEADGPACRYHLAPHASPAAPLPPLTEGEAEALSVAALAARPLLAPTPLAPALDAAAARLRRAWLADVFSFEPEAEAALWSFDGAAGGETPPAAATLFRDLLRAVRDQNPIIADYFTASRGVLSRGRRLHPLGFLVRNGAWIVAAYDPAKGRPLDFALAGFRAVTRLEDEHAPRPEGFDLHAYARDRFGALAGDAVHEVRLLVEVEAVPYFERKTYNPTQQIEERRLDGRAVVSFEVEGLESVASWCLSWGPKLRVLAPTELAARVAEAHREAAARYAT